MSDLVSHYSQTYTDVQGIDQLHAAYAKHPDAVKKEVAQQFESMLMQMVMHSMRDANKAFDSGAFGSDQMGMYQDMYDSQIVLALSQRGIGFASMIEDSLNHKMTNMPAPSTHNSYPIANENVTAKSKVATTTSIESQPIAADTAKATPESLFTNEEEFMKSLWSAAKSAALEIGVGPEALMAQAALETGWGKKLLHKENGESSHNLFNIKADAHSSMPKTQVDALEEKNGVLVKEKSHFRVYDSFKDSFKDFAKLIKENPRYQQVVNSGASVPEYAQKLQASGYATDSHYAEKIKEIASSDKFKSIIEKIQ